MSARLKYAMVSWRPGSGWRKISLNLQFFSCLMSINRTGKENDSFNDLKQGQ